MKHDVMDKENNLTKIDKEKVSQNGRQIGSVRSVLNRFLFHRPETC